MGGAGKETLEIRFYLTLIYVESGGIRGTPKCRETLLKLNIAGNEQVMLGILQ